MLLRPVQLLSLSTPDVNIWPSSEKGPPISLKCLERPLEPISRRVVTLPHFQKANDTFRSSRLAGPHQNARHCM
jgi:hypothetical protein